MEIAATDKAVVMTDWMANQRHRQFRNRGLCSIDVPGHSLLNDVVSQLDEYFSGKRRIFDLPLIFDGTPFQVAVWKALCSIPYGETVSYSDVAIAVGNPGAVRAVASAIGANRMSILVPCHRVIAKNGGIGGYAGGLEAKKGLLRLEKQMCQF